MKVVDVTATLERHKIDSLIDQITGLVYHVGAKCRVSSTVGENDWINGKRIESITPLAPGTFLIALTDGSTGVVITTQYSVVSLP